VRRRGRCSRQLEWTLASWARRSRPPSRPTGSQMAAPGQCRVRAMPWRSGRSVPLSYSRRTGGWCRFRSRCRTRRGGRPRPTSGLSAFRPPLIEPATCRVRADPSREQKNPLRPTRCARRWLAARSWTRLRRQERSARSIPASTAMRPAPSGPRTQWNGTGSPMLGVGSGRGCRGRTAPRGASGSAFAAEADLGYLCGGEHPMVIEQTAEKPVPIGETADQGQQPSIEVPQPRRPGSDPSEPDGTVLDLDPAVAAGPDGAAPAGALCPDAVRTGPWPDIFERLRPPTPLSPPTRRSPLRAPDVAVRAVARAPSEDGALDGALHGALHGAHCGHRGGHRPQRAERWPKTGPAGLPDEHRPCRLVLGTCMRGPVSVTDRLGTTGPGRTLSRPGRRWGRATLVRSPVN